MRISVISAVLVCLVSPAGRADPVARPADSWEQYDLIAKVVVRSIDETREILTYESTEARTFAYPAEVEVVEPLRMPAAPEPWTLLVPRYSIYGGRGMESHNWTSGLYSTTNVLALACRYTRDSKGLVVKWILPEETWETYRQQKETGVVGRPLSAQEEEEKLLLDAAQKRRELRDKMQEGLISREEYNRLSAPYTEILESQFGKPYGGL
jgi:hypothetical protein